MALQILRRRWERDGMLRGHLPGINIIDEPAIKLAALDRLKD